MDLADLVERFAGSGRPCLAVSPHLDDAVLSAGGWLSTLAGFGAGPVLVATVFSAAAPPPHSWIARRFVRGGGHQDPEQLFAARRAEDHQVLGELGLVAVHLGRPDAVFRRTAIGPWTRPTYPTLRFDALRGRIAGSDAGLRESVTADVAGLIARHDPVVVVAPLGIGRHVDHLIVRDAVRRATVSCAADGPVVLYASDQPYAATQAPDPGFVRSAGLEPQEWTGGRGEAVRSARGYRSQMPVLYPGGHGPEKAETLWCTVKELRAN
jgi:LmbE family N-acetylglucosaminyl deacetylase